MSVCLAYVCTSSQVAELEIAVSARREALNLKLALNASQTTLQFGFRRENMLKCSLDRAVRQFCINRDFFF